MKSYINPICLLPFAVFAVPAVLVALDDLIGWVKKFIKEIINMNSEDRKIWFAWYPVETINGWVWLEYVEWEWDDIGFHNIDYIYTKIKENK